MATPGGRVRTWGSGTMAGNLHQHAQSFVPYPGAPTDTHADYGLKLASQEFGMMTDVVIPNFASRSANGEIFNNHMRRIYWSIQYGSSNGVDTLTDPPQYAGLQVFTYSGHRFGGWDEGGVSGFSKSLVGNLPDYFNVDNALRKVAICARNKVNPVLVQSIVTVAELHKTVNLITSTARTLANLYKAIRRGKPQSAINSILGRNVKKAKAPVGTTDAVTRRWLEYRYGWTPLIMEVQGALRALERAGKVKPLRQTVHCTYPQNYSATVNKSITLSTTNGPCYFDYHMVESLTCRAYVLFEADLQFQTARDFGIVEFPLAVWELVPYSFVVDWFIPIGDWIEALTPKLGVKTLAEGATYTRDRRVDRVCTSWPTPAVAGAYSHSGYVGSRDVYIHRLKERIPGLGVFLSYPPISVSINAKRAIDAIALLRGAGKPGLRI